MRKAFNIGCGLFLLVAIAGIVLFVAFGDGVAGTVASAPRTATRSHACAMAEAFVEERLKAPATAEFPDWTEANCRATQSGDIWTVQSYVDAQNGFGALIRSRYTVQMQYVPARDSWTLLDISIVDP